MAGNGIFLTDEQRMIRDMARDFAANELAPHAGTWGPERRLPRRHSPPHGQARADGDAGAAGI